MNRFSHLSLVLIATLSLSACADVTNTPGVLQEHDSDGYSVADYDPLEPINRHFFSTHRTLDQILFRPVASVYKEIIPDEGREAVSSFLDNLGAPVDFANSVLQGDADNSFKTFWRFMLNSTLGFAGLYDFAEKEVGLTARDADFGQTLAHYGVSSGAYVFLPIFGPSTVRDGVGRGVDNVFKPLTWADSNAYSIGEAAAYGVNFRSENMTVIDDIFNNSIDAYAAIKSAYLQRRSQEIREGLE